MGEMIALSLTVTDVVPIGGQLEEGFVVPPIKHCIIQPRVAALRVVASNGVPRCELNNSDVVIIYKGTRGRKSGIRPADRVFDTDVDLTLVRKLLEEVVKESLIHDQALTGRQLFVE